MVMVVVMMIMMVVMVMMVVVTSRYAHFVSIVVGATLRRNLACQRVQAM